MRDVIMNDFDLKIWITVAIAIVFKLITSQSLSLMKAIVTVISAIFCAWVFTEPVLIFFNMDKESYELPMAAVLALTGEGLIRWLIQISNDPNEIFNIIKKLKGR